MILTIRELREITLRYQFSCIAKELAYLGIPFRLNSSGMPVVLRDDIKSFKTVTTSKKVTPSWTPNL